MTTYDLREASANINRYVRNARLVAYIGAGIGIGGAVAVFLRNLIFGQWATIDIAGMVAPAVIAGLFVIVAAVVRPCPESLELSEVSLRFVSATGLAWEMAWTDPRFRLMLHKTDGVKTDSISKGAPAITSSIKTSPFGAGIPLPAYQAIIAVAREHGLLVVEAKSLRRGWTRVDISRSFSAQ